MALINLFSGWQWRNRDSRPMEMVGGEEREGEMPGERNVETYNTIYKIDSQWEFVI